MREFTVKKSSWHYQIAKYGDFNEWNKSQDFCTYLRCFLKGLFASLIVFTIIMILIGSIMDAAMWIVVMILNGITIQISPYGSVGVILVAAMIIITAWVACGNAYNNWKQKKVETRLLEDNAPDYVPYEPGFIATAYSRFKEKTCIKVKVLEDKVEE